MFPITHYYCTKKILGRGSSLLVFGGLWPDLARSTGVGRNPAHESGLEFWRWCLEYAPNALDLARGVICHGSSPPGLDYYADESWQGGEKGWCFQQGKLWINQVGITTALPERLLWWKSHNFVEMAFELLLIKQEPTLGQEILRAIGEEEAKKEASQLLGKYWQLDPRQVADCFDQVNIVFAVDPVTPYNLALKQDLVMRLRDQSEKADIKAMADLLEAISKDNPKEYLTFLNQAIDLTAKMLKEIEEGGS